MPSWQCTKGEDLLGKEAELLPVVSFPLCILLLQCSERPGKWGYNPGGTTVEMAKGAQTCWLLPGIPGSKWTVSHRVRHLGSLPTMAINLFPWASTGLNQQEEPTTRQGGGCCIPLGQLLFLGRCNLSSMLWHHCDHHLTKNSSAPESLTQGASLQLWKTEGKEKFCFTHTMVHIS